MYVERLGHPHRTGERRAAQRVAAPPRAAAPPRHTSRSRNVLSPPVASPHRLKIDPLSYTSLTPLLPLRPDALSIRIRWDQDESCRSPPHIHIRALPSSPPHIRAGRNGLGLLSTKICGEVLWNSCPAALVSNIAGECPCSSSQPFSGTSSSVGCRYVFKCCKHEQRPFSKVTVMSLSRQLEIVI